MRLAFALLILFTVGTARAGDVAADAAHELDLGDAALQQGNYEVALAHFNAARLLMPDRPAPYRYLGQTYALMGKCGEAVQSLEQYLKYMKKQPNAEAVATLERCRAIVAREAEEQKANEKRAEEQHQHQAQAAAEQEQRRQAEEQRRAEEDRQRRELQASEERRLARIAEAQRQERDQIEAVIRTQRVSVCDPVTNPSALWKGDVFWFCDQAAAVTENDFLRRYETVTGSHEAHYAIGWRNKGTIIVLAVATVTGVALAGWGLGTFHRNCDPVTDKSNSHCTNSSGMVDTTKTVDDTVPEVVGLTGMLVGILGTVFLVPALIKHDGTPVDHTLSRLDAERLTRQYNQALERRARQQLGLTSKAPAPRPAPRVSVTPFFGGTSLGVVGRF